MTWPFRESLVDGRWVRNKPEPPPVLPDAPF